MKHSIIVKTIFNVAIAVALALFVGGAVFIKIFKGLLAESKIPADLAGEIVRQSIAVFTAILAFLIFILVVAIYFGLKKTIIAPLEKLHQGAEIVAEGNLSHKVRERKEIQPEDEIDQLAQSFDEMSAKLKESYGNLEGKIKKRTEEVVKKFNDLEKMKVALYNILDDINKEKDKLGIIISSIGEGLMVIDIDYKIKIINPVAEKLLEIKASDVIGNDAKQFISMYKGDKPLLDDERPVAKMLKTMGTVISSGLTDNLYYQTLSGKRFPINIVVSPLKNGTEIVGAVVVFRDITDEKNLNDSKSGFISVASHQLRTPLTSIRWFSEMLMAGDAGKINDDQKHFVERIYQGTERMINLVNLLLQIARVEAGRLKIQPTPIDLVNTTKGVALSLREVFNVKNQETEISADSKNLPLVPMDQEAIWQVIQNLLSNACRYSPSKSKIRISIVRKGDMIEYSVKDSGIGIPENQRSRVFEKFFRADNALKAVPEGSGLGLSLAKLLVEGWGGKIWFESEEGAGTVFFFTVPIIGQKPKDGEVTLAV